MAEHGVLTPAARAAAWGVHLYTGSGALTAFAAVVAVFDGAYRAAFFWLAAAVFVDATDGALARLARVKERTPGFDGARLDDIVDYLTYVFVPVVLLYHAGAIAGTAGLAVAAFVLLSSAYGFASADAKADDHFFTGFPSYWNVVALYLIAAGLRPALNAAILAALGALVFLRIGYVYPSRTPTLRSLTLGLASLWAVMVLAMIATLPDVPPSLVAGSLFFPAYYTVLSLVLHRRRGALR